MVDLIDDTVFKVFDTNSSNEPTLKMEAKVKANQDDLKDILKRFKSMNGKSVKSETLNILIVRAIIRILRCLSKSRIPNRTSISIDPRKNEQASAWNNLILLYSYNFELFDSMIPGGTSSSLTGKITKLENNEITRMSFIRNFFTNSEIQKVYAELIKIIFSVFEPNEISRRLSLRCCRAKDHTEKCYDKWKIIKKYFEESYLYNLTRNNNEYIVNDEIEHNSII